MQLGKVKSGIRVKANSILGNTRSMIIAKKHLDARQPNKEGVVSGFVPGHGGDVWWVQHDDDTIGAYSFEEFEAV